MPQTLLFCDLDLQFQGHWWPLKGQNLAIFSHKQKIRSSYGWYISYIYMSSVYMTLKLFTEGHPQITKVPHRGHFWPFWRYSQT